MLAAENAALPSAKVGGIGDVIRDIPVALAQLGHHVDVVLPAYHHLAELTGMEERREIEVDFGGSAHTVKILKWSEKGSQNSTVGQWVLQSPLFAIGDKGSIYHHDPADAPFATDASLFAMYCISALEAVQAGVFGKVDILHLHDWHSALTLFLLRYHTSFKSLAHLKTVFTIHNLSLQGIRPFQKHPSSVEEWFPNIAYNKKETCDPRYTDCINLMRVGIRLSRKVHVVSPTYASEVVRPSDPIHGFIGGEGLQDDLLEAQKQKRLHGILNGCTYFSQTPTQSKNIGRIYQKSETLLMDCISRDVQLESAHYIAHQRLLAIRTRHSNPFLVTSVGRVTNQKLALMKYPLNRQCALETLLEILGDQGVLMMIGTGDRELESFLVRISSRWNNFIFFRCYDEALSSILYQQGDLFFMPSSFEPCGISQMLAMRSGQPCLVHAVGGLKDTVNDGVDGFHFTGDSPERQVQNMIAVFKKILSIYSKQPQRWRQIRESASRKRFLWSESAHEYIERLYRPQLTSNPSSASGRHPPKPAATDDSAHTSQVSSSTRDKAPVASLSNNKTSERPSISRARAIATNQPTAPSNTSSAGVGVTESLKSTSTNTSEFILSTAVNSNIDPENDKSNKDKNNHH